MKIMICTDGSASSIQSAELISKFSFPVQTWVTVLGVTDEEHDLEIISASMASIENTLGRSYTVVKKVRHGEPSEEIISEALEEQYELVTVGSGGRQLGFLQPQLGATASKLARQMSTHFLVTRNVPDRLSKVLICAGMEAPVSMTLVKGGELLTNTSAQVTLLHVQAKSTAAVTGTTTDNENKPSLSQPGENAEGFLRRAIQNLREAGIKGEILPAVRSGRVVEEVLNELSQGDYDLLVIGAHFQPGQDRWQGTLWDDVTDQLLNRCLCSVLII